MRTGCTGQRKQPRVTKRRGAESAVAKRETETMHLNVGVGREDSRSFPVDELFAPFSSRQIIRAFSGKSVNDARQPSDDTNPPPLGDRKQRISTISLVVVCYGGRRKWAERKRMRAKITKEMTIPSRTLLRDPLSYCAKSPVLLPPDTGRRNEILISVLLGNFCLLDTKRTFPCRQTDFLEYFL